MVVNVTSTTIHFSWQPPLREDQNGVIIGYMLNVTSRETGESKHIFTESTAYILYWVSPFTLYTAAIAAQTNAGRGPFSGMTSVQTLEDGMFPLCFDREKTTINYRIILCSMSFILLQNQVTHLSLSDILQLLPPLLTSPGHLHQLSTIMASSDSILLG